MLTPALAETLAARLPAGAHVYLQSDVEPLFLEMAKVLRSNPGFASLSDAEVGGQGFCSLRDNAMGVRTDREVSDASTLPYELAEVLFHILRGLLLS